MVLKIQINGPVTRSDYNNIIKRSLSHYGQEMANRIGPLVNNFRDEMFSETKNFKFKIYLDDTEMVNFNVKGFFGRLTKTKYRINELGIERYDWRNKFWFYCKRFAIKAAQALTYLIPGTNAAINYPNALSQDTSSIKPMIKYNEPARIDSYEYNNAPNSGYVREPTTGYSSGINSGFNSGFNTGYNSGYKTELSTEYNSGSNSRYRREANSEYKTERNSEYQSGSNSGYNSGFNSGYNSIPSNGVNNGLKGEIKSKPTSGFNSGLNSGSKTGLNSGNYIIPTSTYKAEPTSGNNIESSSKLSDDHNFTKSSHCGYIYNNRAQILSSCCNERWCCAGCHDKEKKNHHQWTYSEKMICLMCSHKKYQSYKVAPFTCIYCNYYHETENLL